MWLNACEPLHLTKRGAADPLANGLGHTSLLHDLALVVDAAVLLIARRACCEARPLVDAPDDVLALARDALPRVRGRRWQDALALSVAANPTVPPRRARPSAPSVRVVSAGIYGGGRIGVANSFVSNFSRRTRMLAGSVWAAVLLAVGAREAVAACGRGCALNGNRFTAIFFFDFLYHSALEDRKWASPDVG